jgi:hypothetical protein
MTTAARLTGLDAIAYAEEHGLALSVYNSPIEDAREGLTVEEAREVAHQDPSLVYVDIHWTPGARVRGGEGEDEDTGTVGSPEDARGTAPEGAVWVSWDSGVRTWTPADSLRPE